MRNFELKSFAKIGGIGSASGLVYKDDSLYIISDNSTFMYNYDLNYKKIEKIKISDKGLENIPKKKKLDFETIALHNNELYLLGSGSKEKREKGVVVDILANSIKELDLSELYESLKNSASIPDDQLNIEGAVFCDNFWLLFQRGNGTHSKNGIFKIESIESPGQLSYIPFELPTINNVKAAFTDAVALENKIYFLASAENKESTYDDGEICGSSIGCIDINTFGIDFTQIVSNTHKFEGLTVYRKNELNIEFLLCQDNDTTILETEIFKLEIEN